MEKAEREEKFNKLKSGLSHISDEFLDKLLKIIEKDAKP